jgi:hypothetical protein
LFTKGIESQRAQDDEEEKLRKSDADEEREQESSIALFVKQKGMVSASLLFSTRDKFTPQLSQQFDAGYASQS